jgi:hypothetical protein
LVSVGNQFDKSIVVWDWRTEKKIAENRLTSQVHAMSVNESGAVFVTVGVRHVKFWYTNAVRPKSGYDTVAPLQVCQFQHHNFILLLSFFDKFRVVLPYFLINETIHLLM